MVNVIQDWMDIETAANWMDIPMDVFRQALSNGEVPAITIGGQVRISRMALLDKAKGSIAAVTEAGVDIPHNDGTLPAPGDLRWVKELESGESFVYNWPKTGGGTIPYNYDPVWEGEIVLHGQRQRVRVGQYQDGGRDRLGVFFGSGEELEFVSTKDGEGWASLIRPEGRKVLPIGQEPPRLYHHAHIAPWREVTGMSGRGVPFAMGLVVARDDLRSVVHHAAVRWLVWRGLPIESPK